EDVRDGISSKASCLACLAVTEVYRGPLYSKFTMSSAMKTVCSSFRLQKPLICEGIVNSFQDDLDFVLRNTKLEPNEICSVLLGLNCAISITPKLNWSLELPPKVQHFSSFEMPENVNNYGVSSFVQLTDIHVDLNYAPGTDSDCGEPLCCRLSNGFTKDVNRKAGVWGDYRKCDSPLITVIEALKHIKENHPFVDYWLWSGDVGPHDVANTSREEVITHIRVLTYLLKQYSPVPILPVVGNHEGVPTNSFPPPDITNSLSISWLYETLAEEWSVWLPPSALRTLRIGGFYTLPLRKGLRVIALNTNYCARLNLWTIYDNVDPGGQLRWLSEQLYLAETSGDKVHIIGHIAPDNRECTQTWTDNFLRILERFKNSIIAQFYGHTHKDEFRVYYSSTTNEPIGMAFIGPSLTSFKGNNPAYRIYFLNNEGFVQNHETFFFNLTEANLNSFGPRWQLEYSALESLNLFSLDLYNWHLLIEKLRKNDDLFQLFYK
ncbi:sphingomyelin phosphodiesterase-like protein 2, partial [Dinothrombium tinctorium]